MKRVIRHLARAGLASVTTAVLLLTAAPAVAQVDQAWVRVDGLT